VTPLEETIGALGELIAAGKVRHWGFSNFRAWKIAEMIRVADNLGVARPVAAQPYYHMLNRVVEMEYLPACMHFGIGAVAYSPLARGVLTGKYRGGRRARGLARGAQGDPHDGDRVPRRDDRRGQPRRRPRRRDGPRSRRARHPVGARQRGGPSVLIGPKDLAQFETYLGAVATDYTAEDEDVLSALCASGHTPVAGHSDPRYPYRGRVTSFAWQEPRHELGPVATPDRIWRCRLCPVPPRGLPQGRE
jgi:aryl-alcohol dehydrogenase-like predicted oxidoreductase